MLLLSSGVDRQRRERLSIRGNDYWLTRSHTEPLLPLTNLHHLSHIDSTRKIHDFSSDQPYRDIRKQDGRTASINNNDDVNENKRSHPQRDSW